MNIEQRLSLAERPDGIACFVEGVFVRFYQGHLAWYCQQVKSIKVCSRKVKKLSGRQIYYGGVPKSLFGDWLALQSPARWKITRHSWGWWLALPVSLDVATLIAWCESHTAPEGSRLGGALPPPVEVRRARLGADGAEAFVLQQLRALALADITPLQAWQLIHLWQQQLPPLVGLPTRQGLD